MSVILSNAQMDYLEQDIFGSATLTSKQKTEAFYSYLNDLNIDYGRLGLGVTQNNTWQGQIANGFAESGGEPNVDVSYNSSTWTSLNLALAQRHLAAYRNNSGSQPTWFQIKEYHNEEYLDKGLNVD